jgi:hypothetical protein
MNSILQPYIKKFVVVYIDDILISCKIEAEHQAHARLVLEVLKRENFFVCKAKSSFAQAEIKYLGHIVNKQGIRPDPKKVEAVQTWPVPKNVHDVRSFLGLINYIRNFIEHYPETAVPLTKSTKKSHPWVWTGRCQDAFELLKQKLIEAPLLRTPDESLPYEVITDASDLGLGGVLLQEGYPVAFKSRKLNSAELNYQTTKKEMLAVVHALRVWRCYLEGAGFTVYTDHVLNTYFQTQPNLSRRQARWSEILQRFGAFEWKYRKGAKNVADALSRRDVAGSVWRFCRVAQFPVVGTAGAVAAGHREAFQRISIPGQPGENVAGDQGSAKILTFDLSVPLLKRLITGSQSLYRQVQLDKHWASRCQLSVNDQGLVIKWGSRIVVPEDKELRSLLISEFHDSKYTRHFGMSRTRVAVGRMFWWKSLAGDVAKYVSTCVACQRNKARRHKPYGLLQPLPVPEKPWHTVTLSSFLRRAGVTIVFVSSLTSSQSWCTLWLAKKKCLLRSSLNSTLTMSFVFMG